MSPTSRGRALVSYSYGSFGFSLSLIDLYFTFLMPATYLDDEYINMPDTLCFFARLTQFFLGRTRLHLFLRLRRTSPSSQLSLYRHEMFDIPAISQ